MVTANKMPPGDDSVPAYLATIDDPTRRRDCETLAGLLARVTGCPPRMWGTGMVGCGHLRYRYESGREGETFIVGFASRRSEIVIYGTAAAPGRDALLARLGRHKVGKGCLYVRTMAELDLAVLERLVTEAVTARRGSDGA